MSAARFTPGPWYWEATVSPSSDGRKVSPHVRLMTAGKPGGYTVLCFERMGMTSARPVFLNGNMLAPYSEFVERVDHNGYGRLVHPDALLIATAPELYAALEGLAGAGRACRAMHEPHVETCEWCAARAALAKARGEP